MDIACGSGYGTSYLSTIFSITQTIGADLNERHLDYARINFPEITFVRADAEKLESNFTEDQFAFVTSGQTIEHLFDPVSFIAGIAKILRPDGIFALMSPTHDAAPVCLKPENPWHLFEYSPDFLSELLSFYFEEFSMGSERPCNHVFDTFSQVVGKSVRVPIADAVVCKRPKKNITTKAAAEFRTEFLLKFYRTVVDQVQRRQVSERRTNHFLGKSFSKFDIVHGVFNPEQGQMWTAPSASIQLMATSTPNVITFKANGSPDQPRTVRFVWGGNEKSFSITDTKVYTLKIDGHDSITLTIQVEPPFRATSPDIRTLGISILGIE